MTDQAPEQPQYPLSMTLGVLIGGGIIVVGFIGTIIATLVFVVQGLGRLLGF